MRLGVRFSPGAPVLLAGPLTLRSLAPLGFRLRAQTLRKPGAARITLVLWWLFYLTATIIMSHILKMVTMEKKINASKFKEQCLSLLENLAPEGIVITKHGKPVARLIPASADCAAPDWQHEGENPASTVIPPLDRESSGHAQSFDTHIFVHAFAKAASTPAENRMLGTEPMEHFRDRAVAELAKLSHTEAHHP